LLVFLIETQCKHEMYWAYSTVYVEKFCILNEQNITVINWKRLIMRLLNNAWFLQQTRYQLTK